MYSPEPPTITATSFFWKILSNTCNASTSNLVTNLFDGVDDLSEQSYTFKTTDVSSLTITATKKTNTSCTISITEKIKKPNISSAC